MSEQTELEKVLEAKAQILDEKKRLKAKYDELEAELETIKQQRDTAQGELERITIHQPRQRLIEDIAVDGRADMLWRELNHHYTLARLEDGQDVLQNAEGETVVEFTAEGIRTLFTDSLLQGIGALIKGSGATGGGATGGSKSAPTHTRKEQARVSFGLR